MRVARGVGRARFTRLMQVPGHVDAASCLSMVHRGTDECGADIASALRGDGQRRWNTQQGSPNPVPETKPERNVPVAQFVGPREGSPRWHHTGGHDSREARAGLRTCSVGVAISGEGGLGCR